MNEVTFIVHDMTGTYKGTLWIKPLWSNPFTPNTDETVVENTGADELKKRTPIVGRGR